MRTFFLALGYLSLFSTFPAFFFGVLAMVKLNSEGMMWLFAMPAVLCLITTVCSFKAAEHF